MSPLRIAALIVAAIAGAAAIWVELRMPWIGTAPELRDSYYLETLVGRLRPYALASVAVPLLVFVAAGAGRSARRLARVGLWLMLAGVLFLLVTIGLTPLTNPTISGTPHRVIDLGSSQGRIEFLATMLVALGGPAGIVSGLVCWLLSSRLGRPRAA